MAKGTHPKILLLFQKKRGCTGDVAMSVVIKAYSHQSLKQLCRESVQEEKINK
jgi:hypothetical protein